MDDDLTQYQYYSFLFLSYYRFSLLSWMRMRKKKRTKNLTLLSEDLSPHEPLAYHLVFDVFVPLARKLYKVNSVWKNLVSYVHENLYYKIQNDKKLKMPLIHYTTDFLYKCLPTIKALLDYKIHRK